MVQLIGPMGHPSPIVHWYDVGVPPRLSIGIVTANTSDTERRRPVLTAALGFLEIRWRGAAPAAAEALRRWLDSWSGIGHVISAMHHQGFDVELRQLSEAWRAIFYPAGIAAASSSARRGSRRHGARFSGRHGGR